MDPELSSRSMIVDESFPHLWKAEILRQRPLILPPRRFTYPREAEEVERGALEVLVHPAEGTGFLATFALGFADPAVPTGLWSCPAPDELCAVAGGYAYLLNTKAPEQFAQIPYRPVLDVRPVPEHRLLLFVGHHALLAWGAGGEAWQTPAVSAEGVRIAEIRGDELYGFGWDLLTDRDLPFTIDLRTGACFHSPPESIR